MSIDRSLWNWFNFFILICIFVRPDWLLVRSKLASGLTNDLHIGKNYLQACVADAKCGKMHEKASQLVLVVLLIGWKSGANLLSQSCGVESAKPITFWCSNENRSMQPSWNNYRGEQHRYLSGYSRHLFFFCLLDLSDIILPHCFALFSTNKSVIPLTRRNKLCLSSN